MLICYNTGNYMKQLVINSNNITQYLDEIKPNFKFEIIKIENISIYDKYSNANYLFKIDFLTKKGKQTVFLKQALPYNKRDKKIKSDPKRILGEAKFIELAQKIWGKEYVPKIEYLDKENYILFLSDVSVNKKLLIEEFNNNKVHPELGKMLGRFFGKLHATTYNNNKTFCHSQSWHNRMIWFIQSYVGQGIKKYILAKELNKFFTKLDNLPYSVIWNDPVYRNIFVGKNSISLIDFDHTINYSPAIDNGFLLAHWIWMSLKDDYKITKDCQKFINDYVNYYKKEWIGKIGEKEFAEIINNSYRYAGIYLVSRTDGKSGSYFRDYPVWETKIRQKGINLFLQKEGI